MKLLGFSDSLIALVESSNKHKVYGQENLQSIPDFILTEDCSGMVVKGSAPSSNNLSAIGKTPD